MCELLDAWDFVVVGLINSSARCVYVDFCVWVKCERVETEVCAVWENFQGVGDGTVSVPRGTEWKGSREVGCRERCVVVGCRVTGSRIVIIRTWQTAVTWRGGGGGEGDRRTME